MTNEELIAKIKSEIERLKAKYRKDMYKSNYEGLASGYKIEAYNELLSFLSTLESEKPMNPDDAMKELDEKIALVKQRGTWDGVDVDKYMDEVRGREPEKPIPADLEEAAVEYSKKVSDGHNYRDLRVGFIAGYKYHADHTPLPEDTVLFNKGVEEGKRLMMEEAVKWLVDDDYDELTDKGRFILGSAGIGYNGYYIPYSDLLKLPKEDEQ